MESKQSIQNINLAITVIAIFNIALHLWCYNNLEYHRDELLYFSLGHHPAFGYATVPPLIGWIAAAMQALFGHSLFAVKLFPALLSGAMVLLASRIAKELKGGTYAQILAAFTMVFLPVTLRAFHLFQPVPLDMFFWTLVLFLTLRFINTESNKYLLYLGVVIGFALLNKYLIALLILSLMVSILFSRHRNIFKNRNLYLGLLISGILILPNMLWQYKMGFPVIGHMRALNDTQLVHVDRMGFFMDQLLMTFAVVPLIVLGIIFLFSNKNYRYLALTSILVLFILFLLRGKSYYTIGVFPVLLAAGCVATEKLIQNKIVRLLIPLVVVLLIIPLLPVGIPIYKEKEMVAYFERLEKNYGLEIGRRFEDGTVHSLPQDYADQLGWEELTKITYKAYNKIPDKSKALIYCENYGQAGAISVIGKKYGLPEPVSFHESFLYWAPKKFDPDIEYFIYINDELGEDILSIFEKIETIGSITNSNAREFGTTVYLCTKPKGSFNAFWKEVYNSVVDPF